MQKQTLKKINNNNNNHDDDTDDYILQVTKTSSVSAKPQLTDSD